MSSFSIGEFLKYFTTFLKDYNQIKNVIFIFVWVFRTLTFPLSKLFIFKVLPNFSFDWLSLIMYFYLL